jgi:hypothetical protein
VSILQRDTGSDSGWHAYAYQPDLDAKGDAKRLLQTAYLAGHTGRLADEEFAQEAYGLRYSEIIRLIGFEHAGSNPVDPMHNSFLGIIKAFVDTIVYRKRLLKDARMAARFVEVLTQAIQPGHLGAIPFSVGQRFKKAAPNGRTSTPAATPGETVEDSKSGMLLKAEQWKRIMQLLPIALYSAWRNDNADTIVDDERRLPEWYAVAMDLCVGMRILHARTISHEESKVGASHLASAARKFHELGGNLTINWHVAMHYPA